MSWMGNSCCFLIHLRLSYVGGVSTSFTGGLIDDGLLGAVVLVPIQAAVLSSLVVD